MLITDPRQVPSSLRWLSLLVLLMACPDDCRGDTWASPTDREYKSENGEFVFAVDVGKRSVRRGSRECYGTLKRQTGDEIEILWKSKLVNRISPVSVMIPDSGRFVVTFDEWSSVGTNPIVIYDAKGKLVANLTMKDLGLVNHPRISRSVSSYWWNQHAVTFFGPSAEEPLQPWKQKLEDTLFIRLHWGHVLTIDLSTGKTVGDQNNRGLNESEHLKLRFASDKYLDRTYHRLVKEWLTEKNFFEKDPTSDGVRGILLATELKFRDALPLLKKVAETERFKHWACPNWTDDFKKHNLQSFAQHAVKSIESAHQP